MARHDADERMTRYWPFLASDLRDAGLRDLADMVWPSESRSGSAIPPNLGEILETGMRAGVGLAFSVEIERRALALMPSTKRTSEDEELLHKLSELANMWLALLDRSRDRVEFEPFDFNEPWFRDLFEELESAFGARALVRFLQFPSPEDEDSRRSKSAGTLAALRAFVEARDWDQFHSPENLAKSISIEAAELLECYQWTSTPDPQKVQDELADVVTYCIHLANKLGVDIDEIVMSKLAKSAEKYPVELAKGSMKKYSELHE